MSINNPFSGKDWSADQMVADYSPKEVVGIDNNPYFSGKSWNADQMTSDYEGSFGDAFVNRVASYLAFPGIYTGISQDKFLTWVVEPYDAALIMIDCCFNGYFVLCLLQATTEVLNGRDPTPYMEMAIKAKSSNLILGPLVANTINKLVKSSDE